MEEKKMMDLSSFIKELKSRAELDKINPDVPARIWREDELIDGKYAKALVAVLVTSGCRWNLCSMCGYFRESRRYVTDANILRQVDLILSRYQGEEMIKIFTSGSFLDDREIGFDTQIRIMEKLGGVRKLKRISIESRPEFVRFDRLRRLLEKVHPKELEISIGLESADDDILKYSINKGFKFSTYLDAVKVARDAGCSIKTYLLLKPPFLTESRAIRDCIESIKKIRDLTDSVSINPVAVHRYTLVEYLWERKEYRPPWLWSILEVLREGKKVLKEKRIRCDVTGGGERRGAHNCGRCDKVVLDLIRKFSMDQKVEELNNVWCDCKEEWMDILDMERFPFGSLVRAYEGL
ncbi:MAG TPA: TIGR01210 family radical SAM protein [Thermoplasmatales archaeon]|nr:TIGR01210 family radical SAM protein [Thermoplasmatales archaeon]HEX17093.1 TIGR01210 family radical SAM protein [Thermoplasmatales archaeon]